MKNIIKYILLIVIGGIISSIIHTAAVTKKKPKELKINFMQIGKVSIWCTDTTCNYLKIKTDTTINHYQMVGISQK